MPIIWSYSDPLYAAQADEESDGGEPTDSSSDSEASDASKDSGGGQSEGEGESKKKRKKEKAEKEKKEVSGRGAESCELSNFILKLFKRFYKNLAHVEAHWCQMLSCCQIVLRTA